MRRSFLAAAVAAISAGARTSVASKTGYAPVNGLKLYYEMHGAGRPLILLHGGLGATGMFRPILPPLASHCRVIAADMQAHGRGQSVPEGRRLFKRSGRHQGPTLLAFGDADAVRTAHAVEFFELLGGGKKMAVGMDRKYRTPVSPFCRACPTTLSFSSPALPTAVVPFIDLHKQNKEKS